MRALAERLGAPVVTTANGKGVVPDDHPLALGARLNFPSARTWLEGCDVVLAVGTELASPTSGVRRSRCAGALVRVDLDPLQAHANAAAAVAVIGDAHAALEGMLDALEDGDARRRGAPRRRAARPARRRARRPGGAVAATGSPALDAALPADAIVAGDSAMCCYYGALGGLPVRAAALVPVPDRLRDARLRRARRDRREARGARPAGCSRSRATAA